MHAAAFSSEALSERRESEESAPKSRESLESLLRDRKLDHTLANISRAGLAVQDPTPFTNHQAERTASLRWLVPAGIAALDARLDGGFPRGHLSEVVGPRSSGRLTILVSALAAATRRGEAVALVDPLDMFDPESASAAGIDLARMLWIRGEAAGAARVSLSSEYGTLQKSVDRAVKALNIVLQAGADGGGFGLVALDFGEVASQVLKRLPYTTWLRLSRVLEGRDTACVLIGSEPIGRSAGGVSVLLGRTDRRSNANAFMTARVVRSRAILTDDHVCLPLSAPAC